MGAFVGGENTKNGGGPPKFFWVVDGVPVLGPGLVGGGHDSGVVTIFSLVFPGGGARPKKGLAPGAMF